MKWLFNLFGRSNAALEPGTVSSSPKPITVAVINQTSMLSDQDVQPVVGALQVQVSRDFAPVYGIDALVLFVPKGQAAPAGAWQLVLLDTSDQAGALGYHDLTSEGLPLGKVFVRSDMNAGAMWSVTTSHELLELLADPWINLTVFVQTGDKTGILYPWEVCDSPEADRYSYDINQIKVSDFVYPAWFGIPGSKSKLDHCGHISQPLQLLPGGYIGKFDITAGTGWTQIHAEHILHQHKIDFQEGSRRERRQRGHLNWKPSLSSQKKV